MRAYDSRPTTSPGVGESFEKWRHVVCECGTEFDTASRNREHCDDCRAGERRSA